MFNKGQYVTHVKKLNEFLIDGSKELIHSLRLDLAELNPGIVPELHRCLIESHTPIGMTFGQFGKRGHFTYDVQTRKESGKPNAELVIYYNSKNSFSESLRLLTGNMRCGHKFMFKSSTNQPK